jgi:NPCBM-associated, NEW3 domain of alpha-galactosidase/F5/8 type C domain
MRIALIAIVAATALAYAAVPAQAELYHPRQDWLRESTAGLFLHWGMFTSPRHYDCREWEQAVNDGGWTPEYWVRETKKLHARYLVLATFHSRLGYARPWPSRIPGSCATQRDFLGELVAAGNREGVKVILYMTDDPQWHDEHGVETLDSAAYSAYKGRPVDLTTRDGFGEYSYDLFFEVMESYAGLAGFWIDNDNAYWERNDLYEQIRERRPSWLLSNNNEDTPIMDTVSNEQKTGMTPYYDYPQAVWTPLPRLTEADYKLPTTGAWWYDGQDHAVDHRLSVGRYVTNAGSSIKSLMAETAMVSGKLPPSQEAFNDFMAGYLPPIWDSIDGTEGGGYMYGGLQPGFWNDGAHGVITVEKDDPKTQYAHVITPPSSGDEVRIRDNGHKVVRVVNVRSGERMRFNQSGGHLTIAGVERWDAYDTVFEVRTAGRQGLYPQDSITATASAGDASALTDGSFLSYWDAERTVPATIDLDLGESKRAAYVAVNQREWSPTYNRETFGRAEDSSRIKDYRVYVSDDGVSWGQPVREGTMPSARGTQFIDIGEQRARYVRLEVLNTWGSPLVTSYYNKLAIDELFVGHRYPFSGRNALPGEAEGGRIAGAAERARCEACSGAARVDLRGGSVTLDDVRSPDAGDRRLAIHYIAAGSGALAVSVNGGPARAVPIRGRSADVPARTAVAVPLRAGANTIRFSGTGVGLDRVTAGPLPPPSYEPNTRVSVDPAATGVRPGASFEVTGELRNDDVDPIDDVMLAPRVPAGWTVAGAPAGAARLESGDTLSGTWTITVPEDASFGVHDVPVAASYGAFGRPHEAAEDVQVEILAPGALTEIEAEASWNTFSGSARANSCAECSGGSKVRFIGNSPSNHLTVNKVTVEEAGDYTLLIDYTLDGQRSFWVSVGGAAGVEVPLTGTSWATPATDSISVRLQAGQNSIRFYNDTAHGPDLDRIRVVVPEG